MPDAVAASAAGVVAAAAQLQTSAPAFGAVLSAAELSGQSRRKRSICRRATDKVTASIDAIWRASRSYSYGSSLRGARARLERIDVDSSAGRRGVNGEYFVVFSGACGSRCRHRMAPRGARSPEIVRIAKNGLYAGTHRRQAPDAGTACR